MVGIHTSALAPSTIRSRRKQSENYVTFMVAHDADPLAPEVYDLLQFSRYLFTKCTSTQTVRNNISGAKTWVDEMGGDTAPFKSRDMSLMIKGGSRASSHVPRRAPALTPDMIKYISDYLDRAGNYGTVPRAAILIGFFSMIRQSNLLSPSARSWGGPHTLRRRDIRVVPGGLRLDIISSKTIHLRQQATSLFIPSITGSRYCPTEAWARAARLAPGRPEDPAFITTSKKPLTPYALTNIMRGALTHMGVDTPQAFTLHGLRRGAAQVCHDLKVNTEHIMAQGTWRSAAIRAYTIPQAPTQAPIALASCFGLRSMVNN